MGGPFARPAAPTPNPARPLAAERRTFGEAAPSVQKAKTGRFLKALCSGSERLFYSAGLPKVAGLQTAPAQPTGLLRTLSEAPSASLNCRVSCWIDGGYEELGLFGNFPCCVGSLLGIARIRIAPECSGYEKPRIWKRHQLPGPRGSLIRGHKLLKNRQLP